MLICLTSSIQEAGSEHGELKEECIWCGLSILSVSTLFAAFSPDPQILYANNKKDLSESLQASHLLKISFVMSQIS